MVGGKIEIGEHIIAAAIREVKEETGTKSVDDYDYRGLVSERLVDSDGNLIDQFLIFVGHASIQDFSTNHREGDLALFSINEIMEKKNKFLPSDYEMFQRFLEINKRPVVHEVELLHDDEGYHLVYYRATENVSQ